MGICYRLKKILANIVASFVWGDNLRRAVRGYILYSERFFKRYKPVDDNGKIFKHYLVFTAICKNEAKNLPEWIEFHKLVGVEHFYIYDNGSTDNTMEVLDSYIKDGIVTYIKYEGKKKQIPAYNDAVKRFKNETKWMGFIDIDEYVIPISVDKISSFLKNFEGESGVFFNWVFYGDNDQKKREKGLIIERFTKHSAKMDSCGKLIVNPRCVSFMFVHVSYYKNNETSSDVCHNKLVFNYNPLPGDCHTNAKAMNIARINHYYFKSEEEWFSKIRRGDANAKDNVERKNALIKTWNNKYRIECNEIEDIDAVKKYIPLIKKNLKERKIGI